MTRPGVHRPCTRGWPAAVVAVALAGMAACATGGITHTVRPGENLYRIGKAYGVHYTRLARANGIDPPYRIKAGDRIYIPGGSRQLPVTIITPRSADPRRPVAARGETAGPPGAFIWPVRGKVTSGFGARRRGHHDGIDISTRRGTPVRASRSGVVIFADKLAGYGNVIIVEHGARFTTVYAHNERNLVRKGTHVRQGDKIAIVGSTGRASGPHLHFEVRRDNVARNPLYYLPRP